MAQGDVVAAIEVADVHAAAGSSRRLVGGHRAVLDEQRAVLIVDADAAAMVGRVARDRRLPDGQRRAEIEEALPDAATAPSGVVAGDRRGLDRHVAAMPGDEYPAPVAAGVVAGDRRSLDEDRPEGDAVV